MIRKLTLALCFLVLMSSAVAAKTLVVAGHCGYPPERQKSPHRLFH